MSRRVTVALLAALACALGLALVGVLALGSASVHARDAAALHAFTALSRPTLDDALWLVAYLANPLPYALAGLGLAAVAFARRRPERAVAVVALLVITGLTTQVLKHLCAQPRALAWLGSHAPDDLAWPSGHATAAMTLALCAVLVAPPRLRSLAVLGGGAFALAVGYAVLVLHWHYPSDVLGGYLVAGAWTCLARAALALREEPDAEPAPSLRGAVGLGAAAAGAVALVVLARHESAAAHYGLERPSLVAGALAVAALAALLPAGLSRV
jgi:membrane-associated phospholipid phosphatase